MLSIINHSIPVSNFEIVRDIIGTILMIELENQKDLGAIDELPLVYCERIIPLSDDEPIYLNVLLDSGSYDNFTEKDARGRVQYFVDFYTTGVESQDETGSLNSALRLHRFIGLVRFILSYSGYKTLGLPLGTIGGTYVESFATADPARKDDSSFTRFGRITFSVKMQENQSLDRGVLLFGSTTIAKLDVTDKGYRYILGN